MLLTPIFTITYLGIANHLTISILPSSARLCHLNILINRLQHLKLNSFLLATHYIQGCALEAQGCQRRLTYPLVQLEKFTLGAEHPEFQGLQPFGSLYYFFATALIL